MFDDLFDLPGFDDLIDLIDSLADVFDIDAGDLSMLDQSVVPLWPDAPIGPDYADPSLFWSGLEASPLDTAGFGAEFGNMQFPSPFAGPPASPIADGSVDDMIARASLITGIPTDHFPS
jgi:hypothetical protein